MTLNSSDVDPSTWLIAGGRNREPGQPLNVAPQLASNFYLPAERDYSRAAGTDTSAAFEKIMGGLEGGPRVAGEVRVRQPGLRQDGGIL